MKGLTGDIVYNGNAGSEILHYYLTRYAIPKNEDKQPRGDLARRRIQPTTPVPVGLRAIVACVKPRYGKKSTRRSWTKFQAVSSGQELNVKSCYAS